MWFEKAAEQGHAQALHALGVLYTKAEGVEENIPRAIAYYEAAAIQDEVSSIHMLGLIYRQGFPGIVQQDFNRAHQYLCRAATEGHAESQFVLATMYGQGQGVLQSYSIASQWLRFSAEQGLANVQRFLGASYVRGWGVIQDYVQAHAWYNLASSLGDEEARKYRDALERSMSTDQITEAQRIAKGWKPKVIAVPVTTKKTCSLHHKIHQLFFEWANTLGSMSGITRTTTAKEMTHAP